MTVKELKTGDIFKVKDMPQWGIMMVSFIRETKERVYVSLSGNRWTHKAGLLDEQEVTKLESISTVINMYSRGVNDH